MSGTVTSKEYVYHIPNIQDILKPNDKRLNEINRSAFYITVLKNTPHTAGIFL